MFFVFCDGGAGRYHTVLGLNAQDSIKQRSSLCAVHTHAYDMYVGIVKALQYLGWPKLAKSV